MSTITIVLAEDHDVVRHGLRLVLESEADLRVIGEAADGLAALDAVELLTPDVLVTDLRMPALSGAEVLARVADVSPRTRVVVLSMESNAAIVIDTLRRGAMGYVQKGAPSSALVTAVREASAGRSHVSPALSAALLRLARRPAPCGEPVDLLTRRERDVVQLTADGLTSRAIAARLLISPRTAEAHRANAMGKLGVRSRAQLVRQVLERRAVVEHAFASVRLEPFEPVA